MKYIHPKLWREAYLYNEYMNNWNCYRCEKLDWNRYYTTEELEPLWFEPVEETPEWIEKAMDEYGESEFTEDREEEKQMIIKTLMRNMPKQQKITIDEVKDLRLEDVAQSEVVRFLKKKQLLQE